MCRFSGFSDLDVVTLEANLVDGDGIVGNPTFLGLPGLDIERSGVPWAGDDVAVQLTLLAAQASRRSHCARKAL